VGVQPLGAEAMARSFARSLMARDSRAAAAHLAADVRIVTPDGTELAGRERAAEVLDQVTDSGQELEIRVGRTVVNGSVALCRQWWRRHSVGESGGFEISTSARLVLARTASRWEIVIVSPWE